MISTVELSDLLADLYAAPLEPDRWQAFFDRLCTLTNVASGFMVTVSSGKGNLVLAGGGSNYCSEILRQYNEHYGANDPYTEPSMRSRGAGVLQGDALVSRSNLLKSELYNGLLVQYDLGHMTLMSCDRNSQTFLPLWTTPKHGPMDDASVYLLQTLIPHVQTALLLRARLALSDACTFFSEVALDAMSIAAFLVAADGRIKHMNQLAAGYLQSTEGLRSHQGQLTAADPHENAQLRFLIAGACGEKKASLLPGGAMKILRPAERTSLQLAIVPAPAHNRLEEKTPCALVFVSDPSSQLKSRASLMRQLYGLTPTEARLADLLLEGLEVREIAERTGTTLETARFHLKRVLSKTGARRQMELVRLMLSLPGDGLSR